MDAEYSQITKNIISGAVVSDIQQNSRVLPTTILKKYLAYLNGRPDKKLRCEQHIYIQSEKAMPSKQNKTKNKSPSLVTCFQHHHITADEHTCMHIDVQIQMYSSNLPNSPDTLLRPS
jgi:hypothetical protein